MSGGHGHVTPRPDGGKARCGGPALCSVCRAEETREVLGAAYVEDLEPLGDLLPYIRTHTESPYVPLDPTRQES